MKTHILLLGLGDSRKFLVPALKKLTQEGDSLDVTITDTRRLAELIQEPPAMSPEEVKWVQQRFLQEDNTNSFLAEIKKGNQSSRKIAYLAIPPTAYQRAISKYVEYVDIFALEKPWAVDSRQLQQISDALKPYINKKILGTDHYLWKPEVKEFLHKVKMDKNYELIRSSSSFDFVLCELELDPVNRSYFWQTGIAIDMIPHVLSFLGNVFDNCEVRVEKVEPAICVDKVVFDVLERYNTQKSEYVFPVKETYAELLLNVSVDASQKKIHAILGKGVNVKPITICSRKIKSNKFFYGASGGIFLDFTKHEMLFNCTDSKIVESKESAHYYMLRALIDGLFSQFIDISLLCKYVELYPVIVDKMHQHVKQTTQQDYDNFGYVPLLLNEENFSYRKGEDPTKIKHHGCCFSQL